MPRDLKAEIAELTQGIHQFIMQMCLSMSLVVDQLEAKQAVIDVLNEEIKYIRSTDPKLKAEEMRKNNVLSSLFEEQQDLLDLMKTASEEERYKLADEFEKISEAIQVLSKKQ